MPFLTHHLQYSDVLFPNQFSFYFSFRVQGKKRLLRLPAVELGIMRLQELLKKMRVDEEAFYRDILVAEKGLWEDEEVLGMKRRMGGMSQNF